MQSLTKTLLVKMIECILQNRVNVIKKQMRRFNDVNKEIKKLRGSAFEGNLSKFLQQLLFKQHHNLQQHIKLSQGIQSVTLFFRLENPALREVIDAEIWQINYQEFRQLCQQHQEQQFEIIVSIFEQLLMFLNQQPLFSLYQRDTYLKKNYNLTFQIKTNHNKTPRTEVKKPNIMRLNEKYILERASRSFYMNLVCYVKSNFTSLNQHYDRKPLIPEKVEERKNNISKPENAVPAQHNSKSNVFEYHDHELDFVFLSSDEETFQNNPSKPVDLSDFIGASDDEFELLTISRDEEFLEDHRNFFTELGSIENQYLKF